LYDRHEDVLQAEDEQEECNLDVDSLVNYSHKFKLINDELTKYEKNGGKKDKGKNPKKFQHQNMYHQANSVNFQVSNNQQMYSPQIQNNMYDMGGYQNPQMVPPQMHGYTNTMNQGYPNQGYPQGYSNQGYQNQVYPPQQYPAQQYPSQGYQNFPGQGNSRKCWI